MALAQRRDAEQHGLPVRVHLVCLGVTTVNARAGVGEPERPLLAEDLLQGSRAPRRVPSPPRRTPSRIASIESNANRSPRLRGKRPLSRAYSARCCSPSPRRAPHRPPPPRRRRRAVAPRSSPTYRGWPLPDPVRPREGAQLARQTPTAARGISPRPSPARPALRRTSREQSGLEAQGGPCARDSTRGEATRLHEASPGQQAELRVATLRF